MDTNITTRLNNLIDRLQDNKYFSLSNIANEIPYFIFDYDPEDELDVRETLKMITNHPKISYKIININIYDVIINFLVQENLLEKTFELEQQFTKEKFLIRIKSLIDAELIIEYISKINKEENPDIFIISGIGSVFPVLRIHTVLNRLQEIIDNKPVIIMYPGSFDVSDTEGQLILFNKLKSKAYYRALKL